jgi:isocitrate dehydrogenase
MMLDHLGWVEAAASIEKGLAQAIADKHVTYDFHRSMEAATLCSTTEFAQAIIKRLA